jgi:hypothetical protein
LWDCKEGNKLIGEVLTPKLCIPHFLHTFLNLNILYSHYAPTYNPETGKEKHRLNFKPSFSLVLDYFLYHQIVKQN